MGEVKRVFNPEFLNRLDEVILFNSLTDNDLLLIIDLLVGQINETLVHRQVQIAMTPEARQWILEKTCSDRNYGARPLRRALQKYVEDPLSEALIQGGLQKTRDARRFSSPATVWLSAPLWKQPRWPTKNPTRASRSRSIRRGSKKNWAGDCGLDQKPWPRAGKIFLCALKILAVVCFLSFSVAQSRLGSTGDRIQPGRNTSSHELNLIGNRRVAAGYAARAHFLARGRSLQRRSGPAGFPGAVEHAVFRGYLSRSGGRSEPAQRENRGFLRHGAADHPPHRVQGQQVDHRIGHSGRLQGEKSRL